MRNTWFGLLIGTILILTLSVLSFAQGKGNGRGNGNGKGNSGGSVVDRIPNIGSENSSNRGQGKNKKNDSLGGILEDNQKGKGNNNSNNRFKGLSKKTGMSESELQARYEIEKRLNPDLTYGQFVAAHMIAKNHSGISSENILGGLRNGQSVGQVLQDSGWDKGKIEKERKRIRKDREKDKDRDYDDDDRTWRLPF